MMLLRHGYVVLTQRDGSPAILREDRIHKIQSIPHRGTRILYGADQREYLVKESAFVVENLREEAHERTVKLRDACGCDSE